MRKNPLAQIIFTFLFIIAFLFPTEGQTALEPVKLTLSIKDAINRALDRNLDEANYRERIIEDHHNKSLALSLVAPTISATLSADEQKDAVSTGGAQFGGDPYNKYNAQLKLTQPLYQGNALTAGIKYANKDIEIRKLDLEVTERDMLVSVVQAFYGVFTNKEVVKILYDTLTVEKESLNTAEKYYRIGRGQLLDVLQVKSQVALLYPQIETAENQERSAVSQLATLLHEDQASNLELIGSLSVVEPQAVKDLLPIRKTMPEITRGETQISQFKDKTDLTLSTYLPNVSLQGTFGRSSFTKAELFDEYSTAWTLGVYITIPIFNGLGSIFQHHALISQEKQLELGQLKLLDTLSYNQTQSERDLDTATSVLKSSKEASDISKSSLKEAQRDYRLQTISYLQFLTSQETYLSAQLNYIQAKGNYITALAKYCQATGIPIIKLVDLLESKKYAKEDI